MTIPALAKRLLKLELDTDRPHCALKIIGRHRIAILTHLGCPPDDCDAIAPVPVRRYDLSSLQKP